MNSNGTDLSKILLITGATSAIGRELALHYARTGFTLHLQGRNPIALDQICSECAMTGAQVHSHPLDLLDQTATSAWLDKLVGETCIDLFIANAGMNINTGPNQSGELEVEIIQLLDLNIKATVLMTNKIAQLMKSKGAGQIALISSLAAYYGLPDTPSYSASKAAVKAYGEGLRGWLAPFGVKVSVVMPGYVQSAMCDQMPGPKPFLLQPKQAAAIIAQGLACNRARISFPFPLNFGTWWLAVLPARISQFILAKIGY
ncbi:MAG: short-chain dehydrogenase/reductase SDR [Osedax symbiont Rs1]|nr:MAG: short-chain dehydrogenase/reductase SDR [Osedax symbiont Rs1]